MLTASFALAADAERAATQLRAAGIADDDIEIRVDDERDPRDSDVGVPDEGAGLQGFENDVDPAVAAWLTIRTEDGRTSRDDIARILAAAGGRTG